MESFNLESKEDLARLAQVHRYAQVGMLANGVTHDVNNLLGAAMAYAELAALDENISPDSARMMAQIVDGVSRCSQLIKSLTSVARKERADINLASPDQILQEILLLLDYDIKMGQVELETDFDPKIPSLPLDLPKTKLAFLFLMANAQEAVRGKTIRKIKVTAGNTDDGVFVQIWDSGNGIAPDLVDKAFEPLTTFWPEGVHLGMGLFVARNVAEMHRGTLTYDPDTGFRMTFLRENGLQDQP